MFRYGEQESAALHLAECLLYQLQSVYQDNPLTHEQNMKLSGFVAERIFMEFSDRPRRIIGEDALIVLTVVSNQA
jgi:hypothetical protein